MRGDELVVISASRRTDLAACYPEAMLAALDAYPPERVHTIVVWTKNPVRVLENRVLTTRLAAYRNLYVHLTVTGLGGSALEPFVPAWDAVRKALPAFVAFAGGPQHVCWRFDPLVHVRGGGRAFRNLPRFDAMAPTFCDVGVRTVRTSWIAPYRKVTGRLRKAGLAIVPVDEAGVEREAAELEGAAGRHGMTVLYCCVPGKPVSSCIDGRLLSEIHPDGTACSTRRAKGQRPQCGCTESRDIGWYSQACPHRCLYCYASPAKPEPPVGGG